MSSAPTTAALLDEVAKQGDAFKDGSAGAREALMTACSKLYSSLILPAESVLLTQWAHPTHTAVLRLGSENKLFEALVADNGAPKTSKSIAEKTEPRTDGAFVARMLRLLASMNTVTETAPDTFAPTPLSTAMARQEFKDAVEFMHDDFNPVHTIAPEYFDQIGWKAPPDPLFGPWQFFKNCKGEHLFEYFGKHDQAMGKRFASMMSVWAEDRPKWFQEGYYPVKERLIDGAEAEKDMPFLVDVGGGNGHDIAQLRQAFGEVIPGQLVLQDRPEVIEHADKEVHTGIKAMSHDFLTEQPVKGARAYYFHSIMQDWDDPTNQQILRSIIPAMKSGYSKILLNEYIIPNQGAHFLQTSLDWCLMASLGTRHRTEDEMRAMIEGAGLKMGEIFRHPQGFDTLIEVDLA